MLQLMVTSLSQMTIPPQRIPWLGNLHFWVSALLFLGFVPCFKYQSPAEPRLGGCFLHSGLGPQFCRSSSRPVPLIGFACCWFGHTITSLSPRVFFATAEVFFNHADRLLHGWTVSLHVHPAVRTFPLLCFGLWNSHFGMFLQVGAALILISSYDGVQLNNPQSTDTRLAAPGSTRARVS